MVSSFLRNAVYAGATGAAILTGAHSAEARQCQTTAGTIEVYGSQPRRVVPESETFGIGAAVRGAVVNLWHGGRGFTPNAPNHSSANRDQYAPSGRVRMGKAKVLSCGD